MSEPDTEVPSTYRVYDYLLGGSFNFAVDRAFARDLLQTLPWAREVARHNRAFLARAVRYAVAAGVRQFLDLGSGIPTVSSVDRVARSVDPSCRVAYVDASAMAVAHAEVLLAGDPHAVAVRADLRDVPSVLARQGVTNLLDLSRPVVLLLGAVLHFLDDDQDPAGIVARYRNALAPGSLLVLSHATYDGVPDEIEKAAMRYRAAPERLVDRSRAEITALFDGWDLVEPGVVFTARWQPEQCHPDYPDRDFVDPGRAGLLAGVAVKPA